MVRLVLMPESDLQAYLDKAIPNYAADNIKAGYWTEEEGLNKARDTFKRLLPDGMNTKDQYIYNVHDAEADQRVGIIWLNRESICHILLALFMISRSMKHGVEKALENMPWLPLKRKLANLVSNQLVCMSLLIMQSRKACMRILGTRPKA